MSWRAGFRAGALAALVLLACTPRQNPAHKRLLQRLKDGRAPERIAAIQQLAPHADQETTAAIARAARDGTPDVRRAVAKALGEVDADNAVDLAGAMLRDQSDEVRAAAIQTLIRRGGPRAASYIAHAYTTGGPQLRGMVVSAGNAVLSLAVKTEARERQEKNEQNRKSEHTPIRVEATAQLGVVATPSALAELTARLAGGPPELAAAACDGLTRAGATEALPQIREALKNSDPSVMLACAAALSLLDPRNTAASLVPLVQPAPPAVASALLEVLATVPLSESQKDPLCPVALAQPSGALAIRTAQLIGPRCQMPATLPGAWSAEETYNVLATLGLKDLARAKLARADLSAADAHRAAAAATYLGAAGAAADAVALVKLATTELKALDAGRAEIAKNIEARRSADAEVREEQEQEARALLGARFDEIMKLRPPLRTALLKKMGKDPGSDVADSYEQRAGAQDLIVAAMVSAYRLGADVLPLADTLFAERAPKLRSLAVQIANAVGARGDALKVKARADSERWVQRMQDELDLQAGDPAALERLAKLLDGATPPERAEIAEVMKPVAEKAAPVLIALADGSDVAVPSAVRSLAAAKGDEVDRALLRRLDDPAGAGAVTAIEALKNRPSTAIDDAFAKAAVHPLPEVRAAALRALAERKSCAAAPSLSALRDDYVGAVRTAAQALVTICGPATK